MAREICGVPVGHQTLRRPERVFWIAAADSAEWVMLREAGEARRDGAIHFSMEGHNLMAVMSVGDFPEYPAQAILAATDRSAARKHKTIAERILRTGRTFANLI